MGREQCGSRIDGAPETERVVLIAAATMMTTTVLTLIGTLRGSASDGATTSVPRSRPRVLVLKTSRGYLWHVGEGAHCLMEVMKYVAVAVSRRVRRVVGRWRGSWGVVTQVFEDKVRLVVVAVVDVVVVEDGVVDVVVVAVVAVVGEE